jgi:AcrR family transcriptional regulator
LDYIRWAREQRPRRGLPRPEGDMLQTVATFSNQRGECEASVDTIAKALGYSRQHAHKLLKRLEGRGLISSRRRVGKAAVRRLNIDAPHHDQLALDAPPAVAGMRHPNVAACTVAPVASGGDKKEQEGSSSGGARAQDTTLAEDTSSTALHPKLGEVLAIFRALPEPYRHVEPASIDSALQAHAAVDVVSAAHIVASKVHAGQAHTSHVNTLLLGVLRRMPSPRDRDTPPAAAPAAGGPPGTAPRRPARQAKWWDGALERAIATEGSQA